MTHGLIPGGSGTTAPLGKLSAWRSTQRLGDAHWTSCNRDLLDAMPEATAVVDNRGVIRGTNRAWQDFAIDNGGTVEATGVGVNYLAVCDRASPDCTDAAVASDALRAVSAGASIERDFEYACPSSQTGRWFVLRISPLGGRRPGAIVSHTNITRRKAAEIELQRQASQDPLTGAANRFFLKDRMIRVLTPRPNRAAQPDVGVLYIDLDGFKPINDTYGHAAGDEILAEVAHRIRQVARARDLVARPGGDEFAVIAPRISQNGLTALQERVREVLRRPHRIHGHDVTVTASVGAHLASAGDDPDAALAAADTSMYQHKREQAAAR
jgi:diguanylate cyclase (GGDEF)-like protein